jgi:hypothetical protein
VSLAVVDGSAVRGATWEGLGVGTSVLRDICSGAAEEENAGVGNVVKEDAGNRSVVSGVSVFSTAVKVDECSSSAIRLEGAVGSGVGGDRGLCVSVGETSDLVAAVTRDS